MVAVPAKLLAFAQRAVVVAVVLRSLGDVSQREYWAVLKP